MHISGRVLDSEGRAVAGARVVLESDSPVFAPPLQPGMRPQREFTAESGRDGEYAFELVSIRGLAMAPDLTLRARLGPQVSDRVALKWSEWTATAPDLLLRAGANGSVRARWSDGAPAAGVSIHIMLTVNGEDSHPRRDVMESLSGVTDAEGALAFGPVPDLLYRKILILATHPEAQGKAHPCESQRIRADRPLDIVLGGNRRGPAPRDGLARGASLRA